MKKKGEKNSLANMVKVSVIMGVYNTEKDYLIPAIESILGQTYRNIEFVIVNDCSEMWCKDILEEYARKDARIILINNKTNLGITKTLNVGLNVCNGEYIARMDSDDVSLPCRIERQVEYLEKHKDIHALACVSAIYEEDDKLSSNRYNINAKRISHHFAGVYRKFNQERIRVRLAFGNIVFTHPSVMFRSSFLGENEIEYDETLPKAQDYAMWTYIQEYRCMNSLQEPLLIYRNNRGSATNTNSYIQSQSSEFIKKKQLERLITNPTESEVQVYCGFDSVKIVGNVKQNEDLIRNLVVNNEKKKVYPSKVYRQELFFRIFRKCFYKCNKAIGIKLILRPYILMNVLRILPFMLVGYLCDYIHKMFYSFLYARTVKKIVM